MSITIKVDGINVVQATFLKMLNGFEDAINKDVVATALEINTAVKKRIQRGPKTGRVYVRGNVTHQASAPGESPATDTGTLASSVYFEQKSKLSSTIGSRLAYAYYLEYGTARIKPRPAWIPETEVGQKKLNARVRKTLDRMTK